MPGNAKAEVQRIGVKYLGVEEVEPSVQQQGGQRSIE